MLIYDVIVAYYVIIRLQIIYIMDIYKSEKMLLNFLFYFIHVNIIPIIDKEYFEDDIVTFL